MAQLKMYRPLNEPIDHFPLPEGYSFSCFKTDCDKLAWCECCKNGLIGDESDESTFYDRIGKDPHINAYDDVFFLDFNGEHIGTTTAFITDDKRIGDMHMVGIRTDFRGKGLSKYLCEITLRHLKEKGAEFVVLTTDEWRKGAVKSYLSAGFLPVEYDVGMQERWEKVLEEYRIDSVRMLNNDLTPFKTIYRSNYNGKGM